MLGKLIKYELKSTSRILLFIYAAVVAMGCALGLVLRLEIFMDNAHLAEGTISIIGDGSSPWILTVLLVVMLALYVLLINAMVLMTTIMIILRFYNNMLQGEGYLMHTLPVPVWQHVLCKLTVAIIWEIFAGIVAVISGFMLTLTSGILPAILRSEVDLIGLLKEFIGAFGGSFWTFILLMVTTLLSAILFYYFCMAIGNLANKNKILLAVAVYIGVQIVVSIATAILGTGMGGFFMAALMDDAAAISRTFLTTSIVQAVLAVAYFFGTTWILEHKLNLA